MLVPLVVACGKLDLPIGFPGSRPYTNAMVISSDVTWKQDFDARVDIVVKTGASPDN